MIERFDIQEIGKFLKTHALKGELNAVLDIDADFISPDVPLIMDIDGIFVPFYPQSVRPKGHFASLVKLQGIDSEEQARQFVNKSIYARRSDVDEFMADEAGDEDTGEGAYADDLIGYAVKLDDGTDIGVIDDIDDSTDNLLFIVTSGQGDTLYIPAAEEFITAIDPQQHTIEMRLPDGLLDINT